MEDQVRREKMDRLRLRSGRITFKDTLASLFYTLMRDGLISPGSLEKAIQDEEIFGENEKQFTNGWLALYAKDLADRIRE
jgi:hypothetical protein